MRIESSRRKKDHRQVNNAFLQRTNIAVLFVVCLVLTGCSGLAPGKEMPCASCDDQRLVRIVPFTQGHDQQQRLQHPFGLERQEWEALLRMVKVRSIHRPLLGSSYRGDTESAFSEEEVRYLAESFHQAFQQATAQEQVVFALARPSDLGLEQVTSGVWFVEDGRIHLRLANYRVAVTMPSIRKQIWRDPLFAQAGAFYELVPGEGQTSTRAAGKGRNPFRSDPDELIIEYHGAKGGRQVPAPEPTAQPDPPRSMEEQLSLLKRLWEQGLITEEDYRAKKQQLLDRL